ncbi:MAG TPA: RodZ domain-containing protein [Actinomycetales bacterium]|nr:RodZ domain-containing protein [Actinomycetales bacterium]
MSGQVSDDRREPPKGAAVPLGETLRSAREQRGLSVEDVSRSINLRGTVVGAIERDDFTLCGGDVYARGHLRAYARLVGLDPDALVRAYDERTGAPPEGARVSLLTDVDVPLERSGPNWALLAGVALVVVVALLGWQLVGELRGPARPTEQVAGGQVTDVRTSPTTPVPGPTGVASATSSPSPTTPATTLATPSTTVPPNEVAVALTVTGDSWVEVRDAKGRTVYAGLLSKGDAKKFRDTSPLRLTLGNAGGVQLTVNGTSLGAAGKTGEVKRLTFRPGETAELS